MINCTFTFSYFTFLTLRTEGSFCKSFGSLSFLSRQTDIA